MNERYKNIYIRFRIPHNNVGSAPENSAGALADIEVTPIESKTLKTG